MIFSSSSVPSLPAGPWARSLSSVSPIIMTWSEGGGCGGGADGGGGAATGALVSRTQGKLDANSGDNHFQNCLLIQNPSTVALSGDDRSQHIIRLKFLAPTSDHQTKMAQGQLLEST